MFTDFLMRRFKEYGEKEAIIWNDIKCSYQELLARIKKWEKPVRKINRGDVVAIEADFSPSAVALLFTLIEKACIIVPLTKSVRNKEYCLDIAQTKWVITIDEEDNWKIEQLPKKQHIAMKVYSILRSFEHPGLVLFSSGSTGEPKAAVHDFNPLLEKYWNPGKAFRMISFLLYDHIGGLNTMFYSLAYGGCLITVKERISDFVLKAIQDYKVELLPTSPTFLNLILISEAYKRWNTSSLKIISYGTEKMPEIVLKKCHEVFPNVRLLQTYGLSELGIMKSKSKSSDSLWVKIGGEGFETRVVDGILHIRSDSAMLGYLNAPSPFTKDGWFVTGDKVIVDGEYMQILGRESEIINVGGQKVYPAEVEDVIQKVDNVADVVVYGEKNVITGQIVCAKIRYIEPEDEKKFKERIKLNCSKEIESYKVPVKIHVVTEEQHNERFKKLRR